MLSTQTTRRSIWAAVVLTTTAFCATPVAAAEALSPEAVEQIRNRANAMFDDLAAEEKAHGKPAPEPTPAPAPEPTLEPEASPPPMAPSVAPSVEVAPDEEAAAEVRRFVKLVRDRKRHKHHHHDDDDDAAPKLRITVQTPLPTLTLRPPAKGPSSRWLRLGFEGHLATGPSLDDRLEMIGIGGFDAAFQIGSHFSIGIGQIGVARAGSSRSSLWALHAAPYTELNLFFSPHLQGYLQAGALVQAVAADLRQRRGRRDIGVAPFAGTGLRFFIGSRFSVGPAVRVYYAAMGGLLMSDRMLPQRAVVLAGGFDTHIHF